MLISRLGDGIITLTLLIVINRLTGSTAAVAGIAQSGRKAISWVK
jgi:hypothetical protein